MLAVAQTLTTDSEFHTRSLQAATNITNDLLDTLEVTTATAGSLSKALESVTTTNWWNFIICPAATLVLGSYGLEPSISRNLGLLALGETIAFFLSMPIQSFGLPDGGYFSSYFGSEDHEEPSS